jgi:hypothetical protein
MGTRGKSGDDDTLMRVFVSDDADSDGFARARAVVPRAMFFDLSLAPLAGTSPGGRIFFGNRHG